MTEAPDRLLPALREALRRHRPDLANSQLARLPDQGLAHWHVRLVGTGWLARIPKQSQVGLEALAHLGYEAACFERAHASGHTPRLAGLLPPNDTATEPDQLSRGAILVEEIDGRPAQLPSELPSLMTALAAIHRLPLPAARHRPPLRHAPDPLTALVADIQAQAVHFDAARLSAAVKSRIDGVLQRLLLRTAQAERPPRRLIAFDAHPGNFLMAANGHAILVDLEKACYSYPPLDVAHATLYTSTTWDLHSQADLDLDTVTAACEHWLAAMRNDRRVGKTRADSDPWRPWIVPLREAMWLWAVSWCAMWRVQSTAKSTGQASGQDWSATHSEAALIAHVRSRVDLYLSAEGVERVVSECEALARRLV